MPLRRLSTRPGYVPPKVECRAPGHEPPKLLRIGVGTWEWTCPACRQAIVFSVLEGQVAKSPTR